MIRSFYFFFNAALSIIYSFLPAYLKSLGYSGTEVANIMAMDAVIGMLGISIIWGWVADRTRRPAFLLKMLAFGTAFSFIPILTGQYYLIFLGYVLFGLFSNPIGGFSDSLAITTAKEKGVDFGKIRVWASIGWLVATLIIGFVLAAKATQVQLHSINDLGAILHEMLVGKNINWNDTIVIVIIIGAFVLCFLSALGFREKRGESVEQKEQVRFKDISLLFKNRPFMVFLLVVVCHIVCLRSYYFLFGIHVQTLKLSPTILSIAATVATVAEILAFNFFGKMRKYLRLEVLLAIAAGLSIIRWVVIGYSSDPTTLIAVQVLQAASSGMFIAGAVSLVAEIADDKLLVTYQQVYNYAMAIGNLIGTYLSALVYDFYKSAAPVFNVLSVFEVLAIVCVLWVMRLRKVKSSEKVMTTS
jgi:MFS transporter, PPP family, 3-phenylpropionic acid transporter